MAFIEMDKLYSVKVSNKETGEVVSENKVVSRTISDARKMVKVRYDLRGKKVLVKKVRYVKKSENRKQGFQDERR
jgi:hypothetical protein